ncbi:Pkinase-domain-containing protein [Rozella allomycis CSF55]|uniref:Pkinase-domain-containing protein n=1 Tax=Rozella allomycis (strain CSF55) TaxID=988480 RepID=A0A075ARW1_ROZAC|nr:Protein kinase, catalytic domain-containing protein [Rozella allomycis CSF55]RKP20164.1 Pkinase-domain-containing protein [Rozella allomycis CSF55]|eukprot:EPZ32915.1 Protein kinase, catalytic domain-containing protein [Rozella allomycis CSF55]
MNHQPYDNNYNRNKDDHKRSDQNNDQFIGPYKVITSVGEGTFGIVYKAVEPKQNILVAVKKIRKDMEKDGISVTTAREIKHLQSVRHVNVIRLLDVFIEKEGLSMVFDYMDYDLTGLILHPNFKLEESHIKSFLQQMLRGLHALHERSICHRDIKGSNVLIDKTGRLKLADFGLSRFLSTWKNKKVYTNRVITLWYRSPELLLGGTSYGSEVDIWSTGCILLEMFEGKNLFSANDEITQLDSIYELFGSEELNKWPEAKNLPWYNMLSPREVRPSTFETRFAGILNESAFDLASKLLCFNPNKRISAFDALSHPYFSQEPSPRAPDLSSLDDFHEIDAKKHRNKDHN